jgi:hypothetical protein
MNRPIVIAAARTMAYADKRIAARSQVRR